MYYDLNITPIRDNFDHYIQSDLARILQDCYTNWKNSFLFKRCQFHGLTEFGQNSKFHHP